MARKYSEEDVTWSSIEKYIPYSTVEWETNKNGISTYRFMDENYKKIDIDEYVKKYISNVNEEDLLIK